MKLLLIFALLISALPAQSQIAAWAVQWQNHAVTAQAGREYLGLFGSSGTNYTPGAGVTFTKTGLYSYAINSSGGGTNSSGIASTKGVAQLTSGTVTIPTILAYPTNVILLTYVSTDGIHQSSAVVRNIVPGVSFDIVSGLGTDNNKVCWAVINP